MSTKKHTEKHETTEDKPLDPHGLAALIADNKAMREFMTELLDARHGYSPEHQAALHGLDAALTAQAERIA